MISYVTSNKEKIEVAKKYLEPLGIEIVQNNFPLEEIQSERIEEITLYKAVQAYKHLQSPILVMDAGWYIPALHGFPGPYMKYINQWLKKDDLLNLIKPYKDRSILYKEVFIYKDSKKEKTFMGELKGNILQEAHGKSQNISWNLISLRSDNISIAESWEQGIDPVENYSLWSEIAKWLKENS